MLPHSVKNLESSLECRRRRTTGSDQQLHNFGISTFDIFYLNTTAVLGVFEARVTNLIFKQFKPIPEILAKCGKGDSTLKI